MTQHEFEAFMQGEQWTFEEAARWRGMRPDCDATTLKRELARPDGIIPVTFTERKSWLGRLFS